MPKKPPDDLLTEERNPASLDIDQLSTVRMLRVINREDRQVPLAVGREIPRIAQAVELVAGALSRGGRVFYVGAGTSGRLGTLDAAEIPPTFKLAPSRVQALVPGGNKGLRQSLEASEDNEKAGVAALKGKKLCEKDVVVGIAASGRTPYTLAALRYARRLGAKTIGISCNPGSPLEKLSDISIVPKAGPEVITGSTRMKSGTAQKLVLNMISTGAMIRLGLVYSNLMVNMQARNAKLHRRSLRMIMCITGASLRTARRMLERAGGDLRVAVLMLQLGIVAETARARLKKSGMNLRVALRLS